ncbi:MAG: hypothetical protein AABX49_00825 [Nanoarchaeota archaeon]
MISAAAVFVFLVIIFNFEKITGSVVQSDDHIISLSSDGERFFDNSIGNTVTIDAGNIIYIKLIPAENNKRVFIYNSKHVSKTEPLETKCSERRGSKCISSLTTYRTPVDRWADGVYTVKIAGVSGKSDFTIQNSRFGG